MPLAIRDSTDDDVVPIQAIYGHYVLHGLGTFETIPPTVDEIRQRRRAVLTLGTPYLVAEEDGRVVGYCYASTYRPRPGYRFTVEDSVYVAPGLAGRGIGHALMAPMIERCEQGPWRQMIAVIGDSGNHASIALHTRHGFVPSCVLSNVGFKFGRWVDTVLMQRTLGSGHSSLPDA